MSRRGREGVQIGSEKVRARASRAPGGKAGGDALGVLEIVYGRPERARVCPEDEDTDVGRLEFLRDLFTAAWHWYRDSEAGSLKSQTRAIATYPGIRKARTLAGSFRSSVADSLKSQTRAIATCPGY